MTGWGKRKWNYSALGVYIGVYRDDERKWKLLSSLLHVHVGVYRDNGKETWKLLSSFFGFLRISKDNGIGNGSYCLGFGDLGSWLCIQKGIW